VAFSEGGIGAGAYCQCRLDFAGKIMKRVSKLAAVLATATVLIKCCTPADAQERTCRSGPQQDCRRR
jgi:hypothetical protein